MNDIHIDESVLKKYQKEIAADLFLDRISLEEKTLKLPGIKGRWVSILVNHKKDIDNLWDLYNQALKSVTKKIIDESPVKISIKIAEESAKDHELILKIRKEIKEQERIVEYLEKMEKVFSSMSYDISNLITLIKMETM
jgi:hypothetical protein